ncbi:type I pullulanase [Oceanobacillus piezotolerans]|uniref:Type I pullulanase n=1 Tax=Oceanobacillus piezotolerans TaxID=2448030 RepID=A0A498D716_9BACI|nr:type I pullulanase [Oceanobacillus piezotolerans]RLL41303.1 type I pullulanase [Oceanobacillus piezotolerans]
MNTHIAWIDDIHELTVIGDLVTLNHKQDNPVIYFKGQNRYYQAHVDEKINESTIKIRYHDELPIGEELALIWDDIKIPIYPGAIVRTQWFDEKYSNIDAVLGATCLPSSTIFSIWAPTATSIKLLIGENKSHFLVKKDKGLWELTLEGDWHGYTYQYEAQINGETRIINDPYAKSLLANSKKAVVLNFAKTKQFNEPYHRPSVKNLQDAIIYELHVRDATIQAYAGVKNKGKFIGLTERETTTENGYSTALSYIKELGCTHVQLLPINDFGRVDELSKKPSYNWGYDPLYFQVPEGSYVTTPEDPIVRVNECKEMIQAFHQEGLSVILDVVYNHVFIMEESPFEQLVPGYYFRYHLDGIPSNGTGVGNDIATERRMVRKFILDTIDLWLREYKVDGFRFDLMGAMDIETMSQIAERCRKEPIPIMLLGEGWELNTALASNQKATNRNSSQLREIHFFNDFFRDTLKGNLFYNEDTGFVNGNGKFIERLPHLVSGSSLEQYGIPIVSDVSQTINYVECHDNHTLWDRLMLTNPDDSEQTRKKMHQLATGITLLSQGVPFIHAGQEWFRTKQGVENSYISDDEINQLDWKKREEEAENIDFVRELIQLRKQYHVFRLASKESIQRRLHILDTKNPVFGFTLLGVEEDFSIYINPTKNSYSLHLPSPGIWQVAVSNDIAKRHTKPLILGEYTDINALELIVFVKNRKKVDPKEKLESTGILHAR